MEERYKCRFCFKSFINGRALGGHMRSHMLTLSEKPQLYELTGEQERPSQLSDDDTKSDDASSSSDEFDHLKRNRSTDHDGLEFDFAEDDDDVESETESSKINNPTRRRSKRTRKLGSFDFDDFKKLETSQPGELEHHNHSSASDTTTEEDLAFCLIMLSRDKWKQQHNKKKTTKTRVEEDDETDHECEDYKSSKNRGGGGRGRFKCETCGKEFKSYQALGGHRASHKKNKLACTTKTEQAKTEYVHGVGVITEKRVHECPICFRVFTSGQALGGHKRSHGSSIGAGRLNVRIHKEEEEEVTMKQGTIDLNLPAPNEEDETSLVFDEW